MSEIIFIIGPSVEDQHIVPLYHLVPFFRGEISSSLFQRTAAFTGTEGDEFIFRADEEFIEDVTVYPVRFEDHVGETRVHRQSGDIAFGLFDGAGDGAVDPFGRDEDTSAESEQPAEMEMVLGKQCVSMDRYEFIIEQNAVWMFGIHGQRYGKKRKCLGGSSGCHLFHMVHNEHRIADRIDGR